MSDFRPDEATGSTLVMGGEQVSTEGSPVKPRRVATPKWEVAARERVRAGIRKFAKPLSDLRTRDANEGDTRMIVNRILTDALGYDEFNDLTTEYAVKGEFADYGLRIDRDLVAFVEVKRVATKLATKHLRQAEMYAVNEGVEWIILTNGIEWRAYHVTAVTLPVEVDLVLEVDLLGDDSVASKASNLFYLSYESLKRQQIDDVWKARRATSPKSLASVLLSDVVTDAIRKELWRRTHQRIDATEVRKLLSDTILRPECIE